jgi:hypothetical protein
MIGNIGHDPSSASYIQDAACRFVFLHKKNITDFSSLILLMSSVFFICSNVNIYNADSNSTITSLSANQTCITIFNTIELNMLQVADILTISEILQFIMFAIVIRVLRKRAENLQKKADVNVCTVTDYSVMIEGLPKVADQKELVQFFSNLYPLDKPDWRGRPPLSGALPVENISNTGQGLYKGTWVAELYIFRKMGAFIHEFKNKAPLTTKLLRSRAMIKMYSEGTKHTGGFNERKRK